MSLKKISLRDKGLFDAYLGSSRHELCVYAFTDIYIWRGIFEISWEVISESLCVFFRDKLGCFMYLSPLARGIKPKVLSAAFKVMDGFNRNKEISRIENAEASERPVYQELGYACREKSCDYLCAQDELAGLKGNPFKPKRASYNYFIKHYSFRYLPYAEGYKGACLKLYSLWAKQRRAHNPDAIYGGMIEDNQASLEVFLKVHRKLDDPARIVLMNGQVKAFTAGFRLNKDTFCILYEITDLSIRGLSQFIFREFCRELKEYRYINIMDDSGLENLKKTKLSYRPRQLIPAYIVTRPNA